MVTSSSGNGGAEGPHPGLDCTGWADKATEKGRLGQGYRGNWPGLCYPRKSSIIP